MAPRGSFFVWAGMGAVGEEGWAAFGEAVWVAASEKNFRGLFPAADAVVAGDP